MIRLLSLNVGLKAAALAVVFSLAACTGGMNAAVESVRFAVLGAGQAETPPLDPNFAYLRVTRQSHVGLLWRGNIERDPGGPVEVYYSGSGEVLRLQHGRVVAALGLATEWRRVEATPPAWSAVVAGGQPARFVRIRDVMPGYRSGVRDHLVLSVAPAPARTALRGLDPAALTWLEETAQGAAGEGYPPPRPSPDVLPPARYALDLSGPEATVVYSEQCLAPDFCFTWQRWSAAMQHAAMPGAR